MYQILIKAKTENLLQLCYAFFTILMIIDLEISKDQKNDQIDALFKHNLIALNNICEMYRLNR